jgi:iron complex transport system permease protein
VQFAVEVGLMVGLSLLLFRRLFDAHARDLHLLVLVGIVVGVLFRSLSTFVQRLLDPNEFLVLQDRLFASFGGVDRTLLAVSIVAVVAVSAALWRMRWRFDVLALGRDTAVNLGLDHRRSVLAVLVAVAVLVSVSTALVGPITFLGLLVANLAYRFVGTDRHAVTLPAAVLLSVICLAGGQAVLQHGFGLDTTLSVIVEFLGGLVFLVLLMRRIRR